MQLRDLIKRYLKEARMMQIATSKNDQPWACTVYYAFDDTLSIYWISKPSTRHSIEINNNEKVAGVIVLPHKPNDKIRGIHFQGVARELVSKKEIAAALIHYVKRYGLKPARVKEIIAKKEGHLCYKIKPSLFVLFDQQNFPDNPRQEYKL